MKKILLFLFIMAMFNVSTIQGQNLFDSFSIKHLRNDYGTAVNHVVTPLSETTMGIELDLIKNINDNFSFVLPMKFAIADFPDGDRDDMFYLDGLVSFTPWKDTWLQPYAFIGVGAAFENNINRSHLQVPFGGGVNFRVAERLFLTAQVEKRRAFDNVNTNLQYGIGFTFALSVSDADGDGISDAKDACPNVPGLAAFGGCPDTDGDGIKDADDVCPQTAGMAAFGGCPDSDGDGIMDKEDSCPDVAGLASFAGCPDTDGDGVQDSKDACPSVAGLAAMNGCPDSDGDGIVDGNDECPNEKGVASNNGCPAKIVIVDTDGDGIADADDNCPSAKGSKANGGCPDKDGDGVIDREDKCIDVAGPKSNKGCPEMKKEDIAKLSFATKAVEFMTSKSVIREKSKPVIEEIAGLMNKYPSYVLSISGYTDNMGGAAGNKSLSERRAKACFDYLVSKGVDGKRMSYAGYGEENPIDTNATAEGRQRNRRTEFNMFIK